MQQPSLLILHIFSFLFAFLLLLNLAECFTPHTNRAPQGWPGYKMRSVEREGRSNHPDFPMMNERNPCKRVRCDPGFKCLPTLPREFVCVRNEVDASARMGEIIRNWQTRGIFGL